MLARAQRGVRTVGVPRDVDSEYFRSYAHLEIHESMLKDSSRTKAYQTAILNNRASFEGKIVLDVGCGTGILSLFAAQAGAAKVYAVDASDIADYVRPIAEENGFGDVIEVVKGKIEEVTLPVKSVDIIISEWMGYFLVYESMLESVLVARDKYLRPGGLLFPSEARIRMSPFEWPEFVSDKIDYWKDVYGLNFSSLQPVARRLAFQDPIVEFLNPEQELSHGCTIKEIDLSKATIEEVTTWSSDFTFSSHRTGDFVGFCAWFDVRFPCSTSSISSSSSSASASPTPSSEQSAKRHKGEEKGVLLSTGPSDPETHWGQTLFFLDAPTQVRQDTTISGKIRVQPALEESKRFVQVDMVWDIAAADGTACSHQKHFTIR